MTHNKLKIVKIPTMFCHYEKRDEEFTSRVPGEIERSKFKRSTFLCEVLTSFSFNPDSAETRFAFFISI